MESSWAVEKVLNIVELNARILNHSVSLQHVARIELVSTRLAVTVSRIFWPRLQKLFVVISYKNPLVEVEGNRIDLHIDRVETCLPWLLKRAIHLTTLDTGSSECIEVSDESMAAVCAAILQSEISFKELFLSPDRSRHSWVVALPVDGPLLVRRSAAKLRKLRLKLGVGYCMAKRQRAPLPDYDYQYLTALSECTQLHELALSSYFLSPCSSYRPSLSAFATALPSLRNLKKLDISSQVLTFIWQQTIQIHVHKNANIHLPQLESIRLWDYRYTPGDDSDQIQDGEAVSLIDVCPALRFVDVRSDVWQITLDEQFEKYSEAIVGYASEWMRKDSVDGQADEMRVNISGGDTLNRVNLSPALTANFNREVKAKVPSDKLTFESYLDDHCRYKCQLEKADRKMLIEVTRGNICVPVQSL